MSQEKPPITLEVDWKHELLFETVTHNDRTLLLDGKSQKALSPMEALLGSLAGCMAIDVVMILKKMRQELDSLHIEVRGDRQDEDPRYFRKIVLNFLIGGDVAKEKVQRAIQLSFDKYCSVFHSLRQDLEVHHELTLQPVGRSISS